MIVDPTELARFEACAVSAGARFVERVLMDTSEAAVARFHARLERLLADRPHAVVLRSADGAVDETYRSLMESLA